MGGSQYRGGKFGGKDKTTHFVVIAQASDGTWAIREYDFYDKSEAYHQAKDAEGFDKTKLKNVISAAKFNSITQINAQNIHSLTFDQVQTAAEKVNKATSKKKKQ